MKVAVAGKGGVGKTTLGSALARRFAARGRTTLAVDCDPNPNLAESFGLDSRALDRFSRDRLRRSGDTLALAREPAVVAVAPKLWVLGGPPSEAPLADAVARGIAGVLLAERYDVVVTDLGAGPEFTRMAVGGVLNPADACVVVSGETKVATVTAERIAAVCRDRGVPVIRCRLDLGRVDPCAVSLADRLLEGHDPASEA